MKGILDDAARLFPDLTPECSNDDATGGVSVRLDVPAVRMAPAPYYRVKSWRTVPSAAWRP